MNDLVLLCKSYRNDFQRVVRLAQSVARHNRDQLPFYLSVPRSDQDLFADLCREHGIVMVCDEEILELTFACGQAREAELPGNVLQQVVKVEFWRLGLCRNFVVIDSDSYFIRDFDST